MRHPRNVLSHHPRAVARALFGWIALAAVSAAIAAGPATPRGPVAHPDELVVLSSTDLEGKTSPCGCHTPKGGFARREGFADSLRLQFGQVILLDSGGWFPEGDTTYREVAAFVAREFVNSGAEAAGIGDRDLHFGLGFLRAVVHASGLQVVSANLLERASRRPVFPPYRIVRAGDVSVGVFSLLGDHGDLGPAKDSLLVADPAATARATVDELRAKGATIVILLSNLGKVDSEDLASAIDGIDVLVAGRNVPLLQNGRKVRNTVAVYGGEQGHYLGVTRVRLDAAKRMVSGETEAVVMGPGTPEDAGALERVKRFEDAFNDKLRGQEKEQAAHAAMASGTGTEDVVSHFVGAGVCGRCHAEEYAQWRTTAHARAWQTLVDARKDATPDCVKCHVVGYQQPGGFQTGSDADRLANVQCENCHGMGTEHVSWPYASARLTELTCRKCHTEETSPVFDFAVFQPHIVHHPPATMPPLPPRPKAGGTMMR